MDRRGFLLSGVGIVGAAWMGGVPTAAGAAPVLSARRAATFRALLRWLRARPDPRFRTLGVAAAERRFTRWYGRQAAPARGRTDAVLDAIGGDLVSLPRLARRAVECRSEGEARRAAALAAAVDLVGMVCEPAPAEDERPSRSALAT